MLEPRQEVFHAVVDPNRRRILHFLTAGERPVQDLVNRFDLSFSAISQHLKVLRRAGLVARRRQGRSQLYSLRPEPLKDLHDWTEIYQRACTSIWGGSAPWWKRRGEAGGGAAGRRTVKRVL